MAKGKRTPALFEIINRAQTEGQNPHLQIPGWWRSLSETAEVDRNLAPPEAPASEEHSSGGNGQRHSEEAEEEYDRMVSAVEQAVQAHHAAQEAMEEPGATEEEAVGEADESWQPPPASEESSEAPTRTWLPSWRGPENSRIWFEDGKLCVRLTPLGTISTCVILVVVMAVVYAWGHAFGIRAGEVQAREQLIADHVGSIAQARKLRPNPSVLDLDETSSLVSEEIGQDGKQSEPTQTVASAGPAPGASASAPSGKTIRQKGWNYLVIQHFSGNSGRAEAKKAERFINAHLPPINGQPPVTVEALADGSYMVMSTLGYKAGDDASKEAVEQFGQQIRRIGKLYGKQGSGYDFQDCYPMQR